MFLAMHSEASCTELKFDDRVGQIYRFVESSNFKLSAKTFLFEMGVYNIVVSIGALRILRTKICIFCWKVGRFEIQTKILFELFVLVSNREE